MNLKSFLLFILKKINKFNNQYLQRLNDYVNLLAKLLLDISEEVSRLKRFQVLYLICHSENGKKFVIENFN